MQFIDIKTLCERVGGTRPVNPATIYRMIGRKQLPKPVKVGGSARWLASEVDASLTKMMEAR
jgi:predicted DNA-binding transcriptional regulator AlpA